VPFGVPAETLLASMRVMRSWTHASFVARSCSTAAEGRTQVMMRERHEAALRTARRRQLLLCVYGVGEACSRPVHSAAKGD